MPDRFARSYTPSQQVGFLRMPTPGLSLVGFLDQPSAIAHLANACVPANPDPQVLAAEWHAAQANLGAPTPNAGHPDVQPIPGAEMAHITQLSALPWVASELAAMGGYQFALVEIDPLLAFQITVDGNRSDHHCGHLGQNPPLSDIMAACLPLGPPNEQINLSQQGQSLLLKARSLNVRMTAQGFFQQESRIGIQFGVSLALAHVVRFNGRHYLHNGFHRAVGVRRVGATHMPCILRDVASPEELGIGPNTFQLPLLEGADPPTLAHFTQGRAHAVQLRAMSKVLHVSWAEHVVPDE
jgi:hypothetical protein